MRIQRFIFVLDKVSDQKPYAYPEGGESRYTMLWKIVYKCIEIYGFCCGFNTKLGDYQATKLLVEVMLKIQRNI